MDQVNDGSHRSTRRALLRSGLAVAAATAAVAVAPRLAHARPLSGGVAYDPDVLGEPIEFLGLRPGVALGAWTVVEVRSRAQSIALIVRGPDGVDYQLDVLARDPRRPGVAESRRHSVFLVNEGDGSTPSDEEQARGALAVGHYLRWAERHFPAGPRLVTLSERSSQDPRAPRRIA